MVIEHSLATGETISRDYTQQELDDIAVAVMIYQALNTLDLRAARAIDGIDRLQFEHLFDLENRTRILELKAPITVALYRQALINRWKALNS